MNKTIDQISKEKALDFLEKKGCFNKKMKFGEKENQAQDFINKMEFWEKEEILAHFYGFKNNIKNN